MKILVLLFSLVATLDADAQSRCVQNTIGQIICAPPGGLCGGLCSS
jgi:hypothetical protein